MSRPLAACLALLLIAAADGPPLPHAAGTPAGPGPGCGGGFVVARGDTLYSIARRCESSVAELAQENRLGDPPVLDVGQRLAIPGFAPAAPPKPPEAAPPPPGPRERRRERVRIPVPGAPPPSPSPPPSPPPPPPSPPPALEVVRIDHPYIFQTGDTLYSLARWARVSLRALLAVNPRLDARNIDAGTIIALPRGAVRPEPMRRRERGGPPPMTAVPLPARPPRPPVARPAPPPRDADETDKSRPDDDEDDGPTPGGMDDGRPAPDGM